MTSNNSNILPDLVRINFIHVGPWYSVVNLLDEALKENVRVDRI